MKYILPLLLCTALLFIAFGGADEPEVARLHIIANSDSVQDIALKMKVSESVSNLLKSDRLDSLDSMEKYLKERLPEIIDTAERTLREENSSYGVRGEVGVRHLDRRTLSGCALPEGDYLSLIITIGEGKGRNWWSVLFPDVTLGASLALGEEEKGGKTVFFDGIGLVKIRSLFLDVFRY